MSSMAKTSSWESSEECYRYPRIKTVPDNENVATINVTCPTHIVGRYVTVYNERLPNQTYPSTWSSSAILGLCEVEVEGRK